jgi:hypothetical protein
MQLLAPPFTLQCHSRTFGKKAPFRQSQIADR